MKKTVISLFLVIVCLITACSAQDSPTPAWEQQPFSGTPQDIAASALKINAKDADIVVLLEETHYKLDEKGAYQKSRHLVYKVLTQKGVEDWSNIQAIWNPWHQRRPTLHARVVAPTGQAFELDPKSIAEEPVDKVSDDTFSDRRRLRAPLPGITPGALVETLVEWTEDAPFFDSGIVEQIYFGNWVPTEKTLVRIEYPSTLPFRTHKELLPEVKESREEKNGTVTLIYEQGPMPPVRRVESLLPYDVPTWPYVAFSTGKDWNAIASRYEDIVKAEANSLPETLVQSSKLSGKSKKEIAAILLDELHRKVRYTGVEFAQASLIPHSPEQVWKQGFGDCKDKATLYISMLRKAGVPAYLALLKTGSDEDVPSDLPGMGLFDHAIVYIPGEPALWVDATAEFEPVGYIPAGDQGRKSLIASPDSHGLVTIPDMPSEANLLRERREVTLSDFGPANIQEISNADGDIGAGYRSYYGSEKKEIREELDEYAKSSYFAEGLSSYKRGDPRDLTKPFELTLQITKSKRGMTALDSAEVAIPTISMLGRLPDFISDASSADKQKEEEHQEDGDQNLDSPFHKRIHEMRLFQNFVTIWDYQITPPPGFQARVLPTKREVMIGPARFTEDYLKQEDGSVRAIFTLDSRKRLWTADEVESAKQAVRSLRNEAVPMVRFESTAAALLRDGKIKEALLQFRDLAARYPKKAIHHVQLASAYLDAGLGDAARAEGRRAIELEPDSAVAHKTLAWILQHDLIGRRFRTGWDRAGAIGEYRKAKALDPKDAGIAINLAILLEYNTQGERYSAGSEMDAAIKEYEQVKDKLDDFGARDNLAFALMRAGRYQELLDYLKTLTPSDTRNGLRIIAVSETDGADAGIQLASQLSSSVEARSKLLASAAQTLFELRQYELWEKIASASAEGSPQAADIRNRISLFHGIKKFEDLPLAETDPSSLVLKLTKGIITPYQDYSSLLSLFSHYSSEMSPKKMKQETDQIARTSRSAQYSMSRLGLPMDVLTDLFVRSVKFGIEGDANGYRVRANGLGGQKQIYYIGPENHSLKILGENGTLDDLGLTVLELVNKGEIDRARRWLDWAREDVSIQGGDDPLGGPIFPRIWTKQSPSDPDLMRVAAAAMSADTNKADRVLPVLEAAVKNTKLTPQSGVIQLALLKAYEREYRFNEAAPLAESLYTKYPESHNVLRSYTHILDEMKKFDLSQKLIEERLKIYPNEEDCYAMLRDVYRSRGDEAAILKLGQQLLAEGKANAQDLNAAAWAGLFLGKVPDEALDLGNRALKMEQSANAPIMHTVASLYAEIGKTRESRELILTTMDLWGSDEPDSSSWYVFGRIAEQYGATQTALNAYKKVEAPDREYAIPGSTYALAQQRLKILAQGVVDMHAGSSASMRN